MKNKKIKKYTILIILLFIFIYLVCNKCKEFFEEKTFTPILKNIKKIFNKRITKNFAKEQLNNIKLEDSQKKNRCDMIINSSIKSFDEINKRPKINAYFKKLTSDNTEIIKDLFKNKIIDKINNYKEKNKDDNCNKKNNKNELIFKLNKVSNSLLSLLYSLDESLKIN